MGFLPCRLALFETGRCCGSGRVWTITLIASPLPQPCIIDNSFHAHHQYLIRTTTISIPLYYVGHCDVAIACSSIFRPSSLNSKSGPMHTRHPHFFCQYSSWVSWAMMWMYVCPCQSWPQCEPSLCSRFMSFRVGHHCIGRLCSMYQRRMVQYACIAFMLFTPFCYYACMYLHDRNTHGNAWCPRIYPSIRAGGMYAMISYVFLHDTLLSYYIANRTSENACRTGRNKQYYLPFLHPLLSKHFPLVMQFG